MVNRIWQHHFGVGIVATENDFGTRGQRPTHPELLDYLARPFHEPAGRSRPCTGSSCCRATYQLAGARPTLPGRSREPTARPTARRRRLDAEAIRDSMLCVVRQSRSHDGRPASVSAVAGSGASRSTTRSSPCTNQSPQRLPDDAAAQAAPVPGPVRRPGHQRQHRQAPADDGADAGPVLPQRSVCPRAGRWPCSGNCGSTGPATRTACGWPT